MDAYTLQSGAKIVAGERPQRDHKATRAVLVVKPLEQNEGDR